jgi:hypothetical protein
VLFVGQWAPLVGTALAALGSLYLLLTADKEAAKEEEKANSSIHHCSCSHHHHGGERYPSGYIQSVVDSRSINGEVLQSPPHDPIGSPAMQESGPGVFEASSHPFATPGAAHMRTSFSNELVPTTNAAASEQGRQIKRSWTTDVGSRHRVATTLTSIGNYFGNPAYKRYNYTEFKRGPALDFPEIPGEIHRNSALPQIRVQYNQRRDGDGNVTPLPREDRSRAGSFVSDLSIERNSRTARAVSTHSQRSAFSPSSSLAPTSPWGPPVNTVPAD